MKKYWTIVVIHRAGTKQIAKISMLKLNIGSSMLRLSSCMLRLCVRLGLDAASSEAEPEPEHA